MQRILFIGSRLCVATAIILKLAGAGGISQFVFACIGLVPLAGHIGDATEELGERIGSIAGGILSASFGNAPELIFSVISLFKNEPELDELIKASLLGSVISNVLLVFGSAIVIGGIKHGTQEFEKGMIHSAGALLVFLSTCCLGAPAVLETVTGHSSTTLNIIVAVVLLIGYVAFTIYQIKDEIAHERQPLSSQEHGHHHGHHNHHHHLQDDYPHAEGDTNMEAAVEPEAEDPITPAWKALGILLASSILVAVLSDIITDTVSEVATKCGISHIFIGAVVIAITGNAAEHWTALQSAYDNKTDLAMTTVVTSALQISMLIIPLLAILSFFRSTPLTLIFSPVVIIAQVIAAFINIFVVNDTKTTWLEGVVLLCTYTVACGLFWFVE
jgi:Ca2+:H+ antiporter